MATIRESLKKLAEVAKPVPGDEQEFVAKHGLKVMDFQGKDALSAESPYDHILKNVAAIKKPGDPGKDDHGHDAPGESEAAYHMPESRDEKIAKLSMMMEATIDPKEQQLADSLKSLLAETFSMYLKAHHFHWNVMGPDFAQYHDFLGELYKEVHGAVDMIAENIRVLGELAPGNLGSMDSSQYTNPYVMINDLMMDNEKVIASLKDSYKLAESMGRLGISNFLQDRITVHEKHHWMLQAIAGIKGEEPMQEAKQVVGVEMHYKHPTKKPFKVTHFSVQDAERGRKEYEKMGYKLAGKKAQMGEEVEQIDEKNKENADRRKMMDAEKGAKFKSQGYYTPEPTSKQKDDQAHNKMVGRAIRKMTKEEAEQVDEMDKSQPSSDRGGESSGNPYAKGSKATPAKTKDVVKDALSSLKKQYTKKQVEEMAPLLPKQKAVAKDLLSKEMQKRKEERAAKKQAGTMKIKESEDSDEDKREANDKERESRVATPRPHTAKTLEGMRYRLQSVKKQIIDKT